MRDMRPRAAIKDRQCAYNELAANPLSGSSVRICMVAIWRRAAQERRGAERRPRYGKIKAARCGPVGWRKSADRSDRSLTTRGQRVPRRSSSGKDRHSGGPAASSPPPALRRRLAVCNHLAQLFPGDISVTRRPRTVRSGHPSESGDAEVCTTATSVRSALAASQNLASRSIGSRAAKFGYRYAAADSYGNKEVALKLGARYRSGGWYAPPGVDLSAFGERGWL
jgi:hypothetical protein